MRVFIATDIDEQIRAALRNLQQQLQSKVDVKKSDVKWVEPKNIHLTLKFLGQIKDDKAVEVCNIVKSVADEHSDFELDIGPVGSFGGRSARVLWVSAGGQNDNLLRLQKDLEKQFALAGWPEETRTFAGHLTLCRIRNSKAGIKLAQASRDYEDFKLGTMLVDSVSVYQSQLTPTGPVYTQLCNYKLS
ncbi:MAG: RNA 2',3'-cyclic phosphodiesterase [Sedimentisphaerales bacterium]|nr:RNA 2',3'-cyclic phosphodiesterase [Sedimentisphaerales bacterium]